MTERATYRIIDANFNRAREALRVIEEYCRFVLGHAVLTAQAKELRHQLSAALTRLDSDKLLACRDTVGDVGVGMAVEGQLKRAGLNDCLTAACKRLPEALRVLAEVTQTADPSAAASIEQLRYRAYTLEKDIALHATPAARFSGVALYVIITSDGAERIRFLTDQCITGGADAIQLRCKGLNDRHRLAVGSEFVKQCRSAGVVSLINDRVDLAMACDADGVHLGLEDMPVEQARHLQHKPLILGATTHNLDELAAACKEGPTYVAIGPAFATATKPDLAPAGLDTIRQAVTRLAGTGIGHVAIGGIHQDNIDQVLQAGVQTIAVCSAVTGASDPAAACRQLKERITHRGRS